MNNDNPGTPAPSAPKVSASRPFFDVVRPGMAPASPTSRPVIARPQVQDPQVAMNGVGESPRLTQARQTAPSGMGAFTGSPAEPSPRTTAPTAPIVPQTQPSVSPPTVWPTPSESVGQAAMDGSLGQHAEDLFQPAPKPVVAHGHSGKHTMLSEVLAILAIVFLLAIIVNILVDAGVIDLPIPHTNFFDY